MTRHLVLLLSSDTQRREAWYSSTRGVGHHALHAHTLERALFLISKVRPSLVLADGELEDGRVMTLLRHVREIEPLARVVVVVLGEVTPEEHKHITADDLSHIWQRDAPVEQVIDGFLSAA